MEDRTKTEEFEVSGHDLLDEVKRLVHEGNVRHVKIKNKEGKVLLDMPLVVGAVGVILLPFWAAVAALVGVANDFTLVIERIEPEDATERPAAPQS